MSVRDVSRAMLTALDATHLKKDNAIILPQDTSGPGSLPESSPILQVDSIVFDISQFNVKYQRELEQINTSMKSKCDNLCAMPQRVYFHIYIYVCIYPLTFGPCLLQM